MGLLQVSSSVHKILKSVISYIKVEVRVWELRGDQYLVDIGDETPVALGPQTPTP